MQICFYVHWKRVDFYWLSHLQVLHSDIDLERIGEVRETVAALHNTYLSVDFKIDKN